MKSVIELCFQYQEEKKTNTDIACIALYNELEILEIPKDNNAIKFSKVFRETN